jgi:hypothetical protein
MKRTISVSIVVILGALLVMGAWKQKNQEALSEGTMPTLKLSSAPTSYTSAGTQAASKRENSSSIIERDKKVAEEFKDYFKLKRKAILTDRERGQYRENLANAKLIEESRAILLAGDEKQISLDSQELRMSMVEFLAKALEWRDNPSRELALRVSSEVIRRDVKSLPLPLLLKKSLAGDQIELYQILMKADPELARQIQDENRGRPNEKLIAFAIAQERKGVNQ